MFLLLIVHSKKKTIRKYYSINQHEKYFNCFFHVKCAFNMNERNVFILAEGINSEILFQVSKGY